MESSPSRKSWPYTRLLVVVLLTVVVTGTAFTLSGQNRPGRGENVSQMAAAVNEALEREIEVEKRRHAERIRRLEALAAELRQAGAPAAQIAAVEQLIEQEQRDHADRLERLEAFARRAPLHPLTNEMEQFAGAMRRLNQGYVISPVTGHTARTAGSFYVDEVAERLAREDRERLEKGEQPAPGDAAALRPAESRVVVIDAESLQKLQQAVTDLSREVEALRSGTSRPPQE